MINQQKDFRQAVKRLAGNDPVREREIRRYTCQEFLDQLEAMLEEQAEIKKANQKAKHG